MSLWRAIKRLFSVEPGSVADFPVYQQGRFGMNPLPFHTAARCAPEPCPFHRPSRHRMSEWTMNLRTSGLVERICPHGVGHPDPDSVAFFDRVDPENRGAWGVHGCDGCCHMTVVELADYQAGARLAIADGGAADHD